MKKFCYILILLVLFSLSSCGFEFHINRTRTFKADGEYTAFELQNDYNGPMLSWVTVTIKNDKIVDYDIDTLRGQFSYGSSMWNQKTNKEFGYAYHMHYYEGWNSFTNDQEYAEWLEDNNRLEWFQQAELIEKHWLENGVDSVIVDDMHFINVTGVSIADNNYCTLAKQAIQNAIEGKVIFFIPSLNGNNVKVDWVEAVVDSHKKVESIKFDARDSSFNDDKFNWISKSKQELGFGYHMHYYTTGSSFSNDQEYAHWCDINGKLEWFQQADLIAQHWLEGGEILVDENSHFTNISNVSISNSNFFELLQMLEDWGVKHK